MPEQLNTSKIKNWNDLNSLEIENYKEKIAIEAQNNFLHTFDLITDKKISREDFGKDRYYDTILWTDFKKVYEYDVWSSARHPELKQKLFTKEP